MALQSNVVMSGCAREISNFATVASPSGKAAMDALQKWLKALVQWTAQIQKSGLTHVFRLRWVKRRAAGWMRGTLLHFSPPSAQTKGRSPPLFLGGGRNLTYLKPKQIKPKVYQHSHYRLSGKNLKHTGITKTFFFIHTFTSMYSLVK